MIFERYYRESLWIFIFSLVLSIMTAHHALAVEKARSPGKLFSSVTSVANKRTVRDVSEAIQQGETAMAVADPAAITDQDDEMQIDLLPNVSVFARKLQFQTRQNGTTIWRGEVEKQRNRQGGFKREAPVDESNMVMLVRRGNRIAGTVYVNGEMYDISPADNGETIITKVDTSKLAPDIGDDTVEEVAPSELKGRGLNDELPQCPATLGVPPAGVSNHSTIRVMFALSKEATSELKNVDLTIEKHLELTNIANINSGVEITYENAGVLDTDYTEISPFTGNVGTGESSRYQSFSDMLKRIKKKDDEALGKKIDLFRKSHYADQVVFVVVKTSELCGLATSPNSNMVDAPGKDSTPYSVVRFVDSCLNKYTLSHEMAHNFGAHHDRGQYTDIKLPVYAFGLQHMGTNANQSWRTIMAYDCASGKPKCDRILNWSNPLITHNKPGTSDQDFPTGSVQFENNACMLNQRRDVIANFYIPPGALLPQAVAVARPNDLEGPVTITLDGSESRSSDGGALRYEWIQTPGGLPGLTIEHGDQAVASVNIPALQEATRIAFELIVYSASGLSDSQHVEVIVRPTTAEHEPITATMTIPASVESGASFPIRADAVSATGKKLSYTWTKTSGMFTGTTGGTASGTYTAAVVQQDTPASISVVISDGTYTLTKITKPITIKKVVSAPIAKISGVPTAAVGEGLGFLSAGSSGDNLRYHWEAPGFTPVSSNAADPIFTPTSVGSHTITLTVTDATDRTNTASHAINVIAAATPITATVDIPDVVQSGEKFTIRAEAKSATNKPLTYKWTVGSPSQFTGSVGDASGQYTAKTVEQDTKTYIYLRVSDGSYETPRIDKAITILAPKIAPPVARISGDNSVEAGKPVTLSAADSTGIGLTYQWSAAGFTPASATTSSVKLTAPVTTGNRDVQLTVRDSAGTTSSTTHTINVTAPVAGACGNIPAWDPAKTYATYAEQVSYNGMVYKQNFWNINKRPDQNSAAYGLEWLPGTPCP